MKNRKKKIRQYLKGRITSGVCKSCEGDCLVLVNDLCLSCIRAILLYLRRQFGGALRRGLRAGKRKRVKELPHPRFSKQELEEMALNSEVRQLGRSRRPVSKSGFAWIDT